MIFLSQDLDTVGGVRVNMIDDTRHGLPPTSQILTSFIARTMNVIVLLSKQKE